MKFNSRAILAICAYLLLAVFGGCSSVGPGLANHPSDCALGIPWADCLPGTAGYNNGGGRVHKEAAQKQQDAINGPYKAAVEQCKVDMQSSSLDLILGKVETFKPDGTLSPPFAIATNESFPSNEERVSIASWAKLRENCIQRLSILSRLLPDPTPLQMTIEKKDKALNMEFNGQISKLIVSLYQQKMTYGEFAQRRYEIERDGINAQNNYREAVQIADRERKEKAEQQAQERSKAIFAAWDSYNQSLASRRSLSVNCTSHRLGNTVNTSCN